MLTTLSKREALNEPMSSNGKIKVAIVGGGAAALTTAFELAKQDQFEITVYQMGWRLGGKGASGRNASESSRIEEHGLHVWMGFYENSFRMVRDCYQELADRAPKSPVLKRFPTWTDALFPDPCVGVVDPAKASGAWRTWIAHLPPTPGLPGDPFEKEENPFTLRNYLARSVVLLRALVRSVLSADEAPAKPRSGRRASRARALKHDELDFSEVSPRR